MIGAIIGDVVGSVYEFNNIKTKNFNLISDDSCPTDDSVMTIALMDWLLHSNVRCSKTATEFLQKWGRKYPYAGYGSRFINWVFDDDAKPYNSYGNGSAMRISSVAWASKDLNEVNILSDIATGVSHNHPEGLKGARVVATCIWLALQGKKKEEIKMYVSNYYDLDFDYMNLVKTYEHNEEICQNTVPQAIYCFLISNSFEDCLRTTISIGGDCDTTAAISCAIAEAYYGVPKEIVYKVKSRLPKDMLQIIDEFEEKYGGKIYVKD